MFPARRASQSPLTSLRLGPPTLWVYYPAGSLHPQLFCQDSVLYKTDHTIRRILVKFSWHVLDFPRPLKHSRTWDSSKCESPRRLLRRFAEYHKPQQRLSRCVEPWGQLIVKISLAILAREAFLLRLPITISRPKHLQ